MDPMDYGSEDFPNNKWNSNGDRNGWNWGSVTKKFPQPSTWDSPHASTSHTPDILARNHRPEETWKERI